MNAMNEQELQACATCQVHVFAACLGACCPALATFRVSAAACSSPIAEAQVLVLLDHPDDFLIAVSRR